MEAATRSQIMRFGYTGILQLVKCFCLFLFTSVTPAAFAADSASLFSGAFTVTYQGKSYDGANTTFQYEVCSNAAVVDFPDLEYSVFQADLCDPEPPILSCSPATCGPKYDSPNDIYGAQFIGGPSLGGCVTYSYVMEGYWEQAATLVVMYRGLEGTPSRCLAFSCSTGVIWGPGCEGNPPAPATPTPSPSPTATPDIEEPVCTEQAPSAENIQSAHYVKQTARVLVSRVRRFMRVGQECDSSAPKAALRRAKRIHARMVKLLENKITETLFVCSDSICSQESTGVVKRSLRRLARKLYILQRRVKIKAIGLCGVPPDAHDPETKISRDYLDAVIEATRELPATRTACS